jgi:hypothetical protein
LSTESGFGRERVYLHKTIVPTEIDLAAAAEGPELFGFPRSQEAAAGVLLHAGNKLEAVMLRWG